MKHEKVFVSEPSMDYNINIKTIFDITHYSQKWE